MSDTSGPTSPKQFAYYDPDTSSWKTWPAISLWGLDEYSETWPKHGMTRSGRAYEHPMSERPTAVSGSSSLLKTPTAQLAGNGGSQHPEKRKAGGHGPTLADEVEHLLPTPDATHGRKTTRTSLLLPGVVELLPTPLVSDSYGAKLNMSGGQYLRTVVSLLPTPRATDGTKGGPNQRGSSGDLMLPSAAVKIADGAPISPPSPAGSESSEGQLLIPLNQPRAEENG